MALLYQVSMCDRCKVLSEGLKNLGKKSMAFLKERLAPETSKIWSGALAHPPAHSSAGPVSKIWK